MRAFAVFRSAPHHEGHPRHRCPWRHPRPAGGVHATDMSKTIRVAFQVDVTGFDPQATNDLYSAYVNNALFDNPSSFDYYVPGRLAPGGWPRRCRKFRPTARCGRSASAGVHCRRPGVQGKKRELTADDLIYSWKRMLDPKMVSPKPLAHRRQSGRCR